LDVLFAVVHTLPEGASELAFGNGLDSITARLEALLGQLEASQLQLCPQEEKKVCLDGFTWQISQVADHLDAIAAI
jgi:hypothetical protein